jgi:hypothetical protein
MAKRSGTAGSGRASRQVRKPAAVGGGRLHLARSAGGWTAEPLETLTLTGALRGTVRVTDGGGREYFSAPASPQMSFTVGGQLGTHTIEALDSRGRVVDRLTFLTDAHTRIDDAGGTYREFLDVLHQTMCAFYGPAGYSSVTCRGREHRFYVYWILDHSHTAKGMKYFLPYNGELVDLLRLQQREDGMIWSFVQQDPGPGYFDSAYGPYGYARRQDGLLLVRQPVENHPEQNFVDTLHLAWQASGDDAWMKTNLDAACRAMDYSVTDRARYSQRFGLLKRGYTIDTWDFQVRDQYSVDFPLGKDMLIDPDRTKFTIFFGENHQYAQACDQLGEMLEHAGRTAEAEKYRQRAKEIRGRLDALTFNGRFFIHRVEEDPTVRRDLGVDEKAQINMSNAYALNRNIPHEQAVAILQTYQDLKANLPSRSPGEFYAIYPPFRKGFEHHELWQYMNGGVHGHAAGELARGAFEHGFEAYGADILRRLLALGRQYGHRIYFAYTGAYDPPPPAQVFTPVDLGGQANMDLTDEGAPGVPGWMGGAKGNDLRNLPTGRQTWAGVPWMVADPAANGRRAAVAVARREGYAQSVVIPIGRKAGAVYLLHTVDRIGASKNAAVMAFRYEDGSERSLYVQAGKHVTGWWFPVLGPQGKTWGSTPDTPFGARDGGEGEAGVAWRGPNPRSTDVGIGWAAIANPEPAKAIRAVEFSATAEGAVYALVGLTLADRPPYHEPSPVSFGGPDNWAGGLCTAALIEGLAGVVDAPGTTTFRQVRLSPRWTAARVQDVSMVVRYEASQGYVAYRFRHDKAAKAVEITLTGSGLKAELRVLLPRGARRVARATVDGRPAMAGVETVEKSRYAVLSVELGWPRKVRIAYG